MNKLLYSICFFPLASSALELTDASHLVAIRTDDMQPVVTSPHWQLSWFDEFEGQELDRTKWRVDKNCWGGGNDEQQCYIDDASVLSVKNGLLNITARQISTSGPDTFDDSPHYDSQSTRTLPYRSGRIRTKGLGDWLYGRFEIRAKLPHGQGTWPAIWMLPSNDTYGTWAASGEIDIMEAVNLGTRSDATDATAEQRETRIHGTLHYGGQWPDNVYTGAGVYFPNKTNPANTFHTYAIEWEAGEIRWYIDDYHYATQNIWYSSNDDSAEAPFNHPFHIILNLAVGGNWSAKVNEKGIDKTIWPQSLLVDFVRVYQCPEEKQCRTISPSARLVKGKKKPIQ